MSEPVVIKVLQRNCRHFDAKAFEYEPGYVFTTDPKCREYDWVVVYDEMPEPETLACPRGHTILATWEPVSIKAYSRAYTRQFAYLLTNRPMSAEKHPGYRLGRGYFYWFVDRTWNEAFETVIPPKTKELSIVCSSKKMKNTCHYDRYVLCERLSHLQGCDWYGHGVKGFGKKYEVLDPYRYHIAIENHIAEHHWTEKIADALLCECLPFYAGDPGLAEVLPADSFIPIPLDDHEEAERIVRAAVAAGEYEKRLPAIREAKRLLLTRYNFWAQVLDIVRSAPPTVGGSAFTLLPRKTIRARSPSAMFDEGWFHLKRILGAVVTTWR